MQTNQLDLSIVVPMYNEFEMVEFFYQRLQAVVSKIGIGYEIIFVDDGSTDGTFKKISKIANTDVHVTGLKLSRNFGHQMALMAGLSETAGEYVLMMDSDLQHPPELIPELWKYANSGFDIVYTIRKDEEAIGGFKKFSSSLFYRIFSALSDIKLDPHTADFRIISRKVCEDILNMDERDIFLRGIFSWVGYTQKAVEYIAPERLKGQSKYNLKKMLRLAVSGLTSFSILPLLFISLFCCLCSLGVAFSYSAYALYVKIFTTTVVPGWTSLIILMSLYFSATFIILATIGLYIAKIHTESKKRPRYLIKTRMHGISEISSVNHPPFTPSTNLAAHNRRRSQ